MQGAYQSAPQALVGCSVRSVADSGTVPPSNSDFLPIDGAGKGSRDKQFLEGGLQLNDINKPLEAGVIEAPPFPRRGGGDCGECELADDPPARSEVPFLDLG